MKIEITYPLRKKHKLKRQDIINRIKWPFLLAAYVCPIINICVGGKSWSIIVLWSLWIVWSFFFSPYLVELNRISQLIKLIANASILIVIIDLLLSPVSWAVNIVPIVCFGGLIASGVLFFTDLDRQKQNMMPMLLLIIFSILFPIIVPIFWKQVSWWALIVMGALAIALLAASFMVLGNDFIREFKKRFHIK